MLLVYSTEAELARDFYLFIFFSLQCASSWREKQCSAKKKYTQRTEESGKTATVCLCECECVGFLSGLGRRRSLWVSNYQQVCSPTDDPLKSVFKVSLK